MNDYADMLMLSFLAFAVAVALPAVFAFISGLIEYIRARKEAERNLWR